MCRQVLCKNFLSFHVTGISSWPSLMPVFSYSFSLTMLMHMTSKLPFQLSALTTKQIKHRNTMLGKILSPYRKGHSMYCSVSEWPLLKFITRF